MENNNEINGIIAISSIISSILIILFFLFFVLSKDYNFLYLSMVFLLFIFICIGLTPLDKKYDLTYQDGYNDYPSKKIYTRIENLKSNLKILEPLDYELREYIRGWNDAEYNNYIKKRKEDRKKSEEELINNISK